MQNISLQIPDNKYSFFMELVQSLGFVQVNRKESSVLSAAQIQAVEEERRKLKEDSGYGMDWEDARKTLKTD